VQTLQFVRALVGIAERIRFAARYVCLGTMHRTMGAQDEE
jgi:hypothetical protein